MSQQPLNYIDLNALSSVKDGEGTYLTEYDKEATKQYFLQHVNQNTVFFHSIEEKLDYLFENGYYEKTMFDQYSFADVKDLYKFAYSFKFRFQSFMGALKYYTQYTLKTTDGQRYLERYEDRVVAVALGLARGDINLAKSLVEEIITGRFQPATPTFLNLGKARRGELTSCFLLQIQDNMESISKAIDASLQLSKRGGGVAFCLSSLRGNGDPIKEIKDRSSGVIPVMKILEDSFSYANQLGARQGSGAVYLNAHHPDILQFIDTKRENADEKVRIKSLSTGVVIPDITFELAKNNQDMFLFSPYDVEREYGKPFGEISVTKLYDEMVQNENITKKKINAREFFTRIAEIQTESGYPYIMFEDNANRQHNNAGWLNMSNLCVEIMQYSEASTYKEDGSYEHVGRDISCNLGSLNIAKVMDGRNVRSTVENAVKALTNVSLQSNLKCVPSIYRGNSESHSIGLGQMNLHGFLARESIMYGSPEALEFVDAYFRTVAFHALWTSCKIAKETGETYLGFEQSKYASGEYFDKYTNIEEEFIPSLTKHLLDKYNFKVPTVESWLELKDSVQKYGLFNAYLQAVPPTGSISYINNSTASIHPVTDVVETRKEGMTGRVYYPMPFLSKETLPYYVDAYELGWKALIDTYAVAQKHVDQSLSLTVFLKGGITTREINKMQIYAWSKGIKTLYYVRLKQQELKGTECKACAL